MSPKATGTRARARVAAQHGAGLPEASERAVCWHRHLLSVDAKEECKTMRSLTHLFDPLVPRPEEATVPVQLNHYAFFRSMRLTLRPVLGRTTRTTIPYRPL